MDCEPLGSLDWNGAMPVEASCAAVGCPMTSAEAKPRAAAAGGTQRGSIGAARQACGAREAGRRCMATAPSRIASRGAPPSASSMNVRAAKHCRHSLNACTWALLLAASKDVVVGMGRHGASAFRRGKLVKIFSRPMKKMAVHCGAGDRFRCRTGWLAVSPGNPVQAPDARHDTCLVDHASPISAGIGHG